MIVCVCLLEHPAICIICALLSFWHCGFFSFWLENFKRVRCVCVGMHRMLRMVMESVWKLFTACKFKLNERENWTKKPHDYARNLTLDLILSPFSHSVEQNALNRIVRPQFSLNRFYLNWERERARVHNWNKFRAPKKLSNGIREPTTWLGAVIKHSINSILVWKKTWMPHFGISENAKNRHIH